MKTVLVVGHCGLDGPRIEKFVKDMGYEAIQTPTVQGLKTHLEQGKPADLLLVNRIFAAEHAEGIKIIDELHKQYPALKMMLVSNYEDAQEQAQQAGAIKGFGKAQLNEQVAGTLIKQALT